jgi:hypothetical protein
MGYKRIIDGKTYNTDTATLVHEVSGSSDSVYEGLYQTKHGAFFLWWYNDNFEVGDIKPLIDEDALKWLEDKRTPSAIVEQFFGDFPEGGAAEFRITLRLPGNLYRQVAASAVGQNLSLNTFIMRVLEQTVRPSVS